MTSHETSEYALCPRSVIGEMFTLLCGGSYQQIDSEPLTELDNGLFIVPEEWL